MRRMLRILGVLMIVAGLLGLGWTITVWRWQDPFTGLYTRWQQHRLADQYDRILAQASPRPTGHTVTKAQETVAVAREAAAYRRTARPGQPIGRIVIGRIGLNIVMVDGTDHDSLEKGPGRDERTYMPGEHRLVYIAGHRTTYGAPFAHIDDIRNGDYIRLELPYATFLYRAASHRIVRADNLSVLRSPRHEVLRLQACHPRFFATHRYLVDARLVKVQPRGGRAYALDG